MGQTWHCIIDGRQLGPISSSQLQSLANRKELLPSHLIRLDTMSDWVPANRAKGLFEKIADANGMPHVSIIPSAVKRWLIHDGSQQTGPYDDKALMGMVARGVLRPEHDVRRTDHLDWVKAAEVNGLFGSLQSLPQSPISTNDTRIDFACPKCGKKLSAKPKIAGTSQKCPSCHALVTVPQRATSIVESKLPGSEQTPLPHSTAPPPPPPVEQPILIQRSTSTAPPPIPIGGFSFRKLFRTLTNKVAQAIDERPKQGTIAFYGLGSQVDVGSGLLREPLVYATGQRFHQVYDASLIELPLRTSSQIVADRLPYWPSYHECSPAQRARYLIWLYGGRRDPAIEVGYVFIFFYGLERRILIDGQDHETVVRELLRLLAIYRDSRSFTKYATSLLWMAVFLSAQRGGLSASLIQSAIQETTWWDDECTRCCLGYFARQQLPLPLDLVLAIADQDKRSPNSVVTRRHADQFRNLFAARFQKVFPNGFYLETGKPESGIDYHAGSPTLLAIHNKLPELAGQTLPNVVSWSAQFAALVNIWTECVEDLRGFDRASRHVNGGDITAEMYEALPTELRTYDHPELDKWQQLIDECVDGGDWPVLAVSQLAEIKEIPKREQLTKRQSEGIAETAEAIGLAIEPDARRSGSNYRWDDRVVVFRETGETATQDEWKAYHSATILFQLGLAIAQADEQVDPVELDRISKHLQQQFNLGKRLTKRLEARKHLIGLCGKSDVTIARRLQRTLTLPQRQFVGEFLVGIAVADKSVTVDEQRALTKAYRNLAIPAEQLGELLDRYRRSQDAEGAAGAVTQPVEGADLAPVVLDLVRIRAIREETAQVQEMLQNVLEAVDLLDDEARIGDKDIGDSDATLQVVPVMSSVLRTESVSLVISDQFPESASALTLEDESAAGVASVTVGLQAVPEMYRDVSNRIIGQREWHRTALSTLVREHGVMLNATLEAINEWSMETFGDWLVEEQGETVLIHTELMENR